MKGLLRPPSLYIESLYLVVTMRRTLTKDEIVETLSKELPYLREKYGVVKIAIFGSFAKGSPGKKSDVDILVELSKPLGLEFVALADYLKAVLDRKVDIATFDCLKRSLQNPRYRPIAQDVERNLLYVEEKRG